MEWEKDFEHCSYGGFQKRWVPKMVGLFHGQSQSKMDDLGVAPFQETPGGMNIHNSQLFNSLRHSAGPSGCCRGGRLILDVDHFCHSSSPSGSNRELRRINDGVLEAIHRNGNRFTSCRLNHHIDPNDWATQVRPDSFIFVREMCHRMFTVKSEVNGGFCWPELI